MQRDVRRALREALTRVYGETVPEDTSLEVEVPRDKDHGDLATNAAMILAKVLRRSPRSIAEALVPELRRREDLFSEVSLAGPGFINFRIAPSRLRQGLTGLLAAGKEYGRSDEGGGASVMVEYVSANPTGPLNVVNARAAAFGGALARILEASGHRVRTEFYVNDVGRQIDLFGESVLARYNELHGLGNETLPEEGYQGRYVGELAAALDRTLVDSAMEGLGKAEQIELMSRFAVARVREWQERDLGAYGSVFDRWFHQHELYPEGIAAALAALEERGLVDCREGARWFRSTDFGDDQDRVVMRADGRPTYFLADLAYHATKHERGVGRSIDIWGPDHHGYIARMQAGTRALGFGENWLEILIVQQVNLISGGEPVKMSKRRGEFITLQDLIDEVGKDAARFFFLQRRAESHLDFDMDLARKESDENPVFYVKYAHARISGVLRKAAEAGLGNVEAPDLGLLTEPAALGLVKVLLRFPGVVASAAREREPHRLTGYLREAAQAFHLFYHHCRVVGEDRDLSEARLALCRAARLVVANGLALLDIEAPERM